MKALILGHNGMLGHMVLRFLESKGVDCTTTLCRWPSVDFDNFIKNYQGDYIINCIGSIPQKNNNFDVNFKFIPEKLSSCKIIHPGSDCEDDNSDYGKSKKKASDFIKSNCKNTKIIKTSIIGPEISGSTGLLEWFLSQKEVKGYSEFYWNGNTTLTWAQYCLKIMEGWNDYGVEAILHSNCISKYSLLKAINKIYCKNINIIKTEKPAGDRCLSGGIQTPDIIDQLKELKMEQLKASICIPATRMAGLKKCVDAIVKNAGVSVCDYEILWEEDKDRTGCSETLKRLVSRSKSNRIMFLADDCIPDKNFLKYALESMETLPDGWGVVGLTTIDTKLKIKINDFGHWMADKKMLQYIPGGDFFSCEYRHCYCDEELRDIAEEQSKFFSSEKSIIYHSHPIHGSCETDEVYTKAYSRENMDHDRSVYFRRKRARMQKKYGIKLAIGIPLTDEMVYRHFFFSFVKVITEYMSGLVKAGKPISFDVLMPDFPCQIDAARNNIVNQALNIGCTHILFMDSDQIYSTDNMIEKMLAHDKPVLGARVHRRYPPFDPLLMEGEIGKLVQVKDDQIKNDDGSFKDEVKVDYTGTGCILYDMKIFNDMIPEKWFQFKTDEDGRPIGEDIWFCEKLKKLGVPVVVDASIDIKHLTLMAADWGTYKLFQKIMK